MRTSLIAIGLALMGQTAVAQAPLSAIDWLDAVPMLQPPVFSEPPVTDTANVPTIEVQPLDDSGAIVVGLLPTHVTGLPIDLWHDSRANTLSDLAGALDVTEFPALTRLLVTLLLAEAEPPKDAKTGTEFLVSRVRKLLELGAVDPAEALLRQAGPETRSLFPLWFDISLLTNRAGDACERLSAAPHLITDPKVRVFCAARNQDWSTAVMVLQGAAALGTVSDREEDLLSRFLDPELAEEWPAMAPVSQPTPLDFRLYEAIGEPLPTATLPRAFAVIDLEGDAGWKAQLDAAERLARVGTISENRLLGIYSNRRPAASGGVWERVKAVNVLETALKSEDPDRIAKALTTAWPMLKRAGLASTFAEIFGPQLLDATLTGRAAELAHEAAMLSVDYELASASLPATMPGRALLAAVATGQAAKQTSGSQTEQAIQRAFSPNPEPPVLLAQMLQDDKLGEVILRAMSLFVTGAEGNPQDLTDAIVTLRAVGLEQTARRATLFLLLTNGAR